MQVAISADMNAACASFFLTVASEEGMNRARRQMRDRLRPVSYTHLIVDDLGNTVYDGNYSTDMEASGEVISNSNVLLWKQMCIRDR